MNRQIVEFHKFAAVSNSTNFADLNNNGDANNNNASDVNGAFPISFRTSLPPSILGIAPVDKENSSSCVDNETALRMAPDTSAAPSTVGQSLPSINWLKIVSDPDKIYYFANKCAKVSEWKYSNQLFLHTILFQTFRLADELKNNRYRDSDRNHFILNERGKIREIDAPKIYDRVPQKLLNNLVLLPALRDKFIYDNAASLAGRGLQFSRNRIEAHFRKALKEFGHDFHCIKLDVKSFFASIDRGLLYEDLMAALAMPELSYLFSVIIGNRKEKSLNLGSECPQTFAIFYLHRLDDFVKIVNSVKYYGRYMDDCYIFVKSLAEAEWLLSTINDYIEKDRHLRLNQKKTVITKSTQGITFLQVNYWIGQNSKGNWVLKKKPCKARFRREHRKLKHYRRYWDKPSCRMTRDQVEMAFKSWKGATLKLGSCEKEVAREERYYHKLFDGVTDKSIIKEQLPLNCLVEVTL